MPAPDREPALSSLSRRDWTLAATAAAFLPAIPALADKSPAKLPEDLSTREGEDWPTFLGPHGDGKSTETGLLKEWPAAGPPIKWKLECGTGYAIGSVSLGRYVHFDKFRRDARVRCLNVETGKELWTFEYPSTYQDLYGYDDGPRTSPVIDGDRVYLYGVEGMIHCLELATGKLVWKKDVASDYGVIQNFFGVGGAPAVLGDLLIAIVGGSPESSKLVPPGQLDRVEPNGSAVVAFDKHDGTEKWRLGDDLASYSSIKLAKIAGRDWGFAFCRAGLIGFDPIAGKVDFEFPWRAKLLESVNASDPVVVGDEVFISETYGPGSALLKVSPGKHEVVWQDKATERRKSMQTHWNTAVHHEGFLYASSGRHTENAELRCVEWKTGKVRWSEPELSRCSLTFADGRLLVQGEYGALHLVATNPDRFEKLATVEFKEVAVAGPPRPGAKADPGRNLLRYPAWASPAIARGFMLVRGEGRVVCCDLRG